MNFVWLFLSVFFFLLLRCMIIISCSYVYGFRFCSFLLWVGVYVRGFFMLKMVAMWGKRQVVVCELGCGVGWYE